MGESFYVTGGTLRSDAPSYVERHADRELYDTLSRGEYCYVLNTRQMGKSSLMVRTAVRLRAEGHCVAVLDLTAVGQNLEPSQWYLGLLLNLGQQLDLEDELEDFWLDHPGMGFLQRFIAAIHAVVLPRGGGEETGHPRLFVFVDEIDAVRSLPFSADEFFGGIRECYNRRAIDPSFDRIAFCLLGVATPTDLIRDTRVSPFNIGRCIRITDFSTAEAAPLVQGLHYRPNSANPIPDGGGTQQAEALLERVLYWTNGQPYLTQRLCRAAAEALAAEKSLRPSDIDLLCAELFLTKRARESDDHLAFVRNRLLRSEADPASLLDHYQKVCAGKKVADDDTDPLCAILKLSGVVREVEGQLRVRNRIYEQVFDRAWVIDHMPGAELRRQQRAYLRGLLQAAGVGGALLLLMAALTGFALQERDRAREASSKSHNASALLREVQWKEEQGRRDYQTLLARLQRERQRADQLAGELRRMRQRLEKLDRRR